MTSGHEMIATGDREAVAEEPVLFVFGSARGGTTFLSKVLTDWFSYGMGPEGTFIQEIVTRADQYGDLNKDDNCLQLARDIIATPTFQIIENRWDKESFSVEPDEILQLMPRRDAAAAIYAAFKVMAEKLGKRRVGNKNPGYWRELALLHELFPAQARYLFIVRDGRDVALSLKDVPWGGHSFYEAATIWKTMVSTVKAFETRLPAGRLLRIRYEDLLGQPGPTIERLGAFIGEQNLHDLRRDYEQSAARNSLQANYGKWREEMNDRQQRVYEAVAGALLDELGYERRFPDARLSTLEKLRYETQVLWRKVWANLYHLQSSLPLDARKSGRNRLAKLFQPGNSGKSN